MFGRQENSTGFLLEQLAEGLRRRFLVNVATARQGTRMRTGLLARFADAVVAAFRVAWTVLLRARRGDVVVVVTNPPLLPPLIAAIRRWRRIRLIILVHDVYPEALYVATRRRGIVPAIFARWNARALRSADRVVVIGRDMERLLAEKIDRPANHFEVIPNWTTLQPGEVPADIRDLDHETLVVQYSGKLGWGHNARLLADAAAILQRRKLAVRIDVYAWGAQIETLQDEIRTQQLTNVALHPPCAREYLGAQLADCDLGLIVMRGGMAGVSVPCRLYNRLAAGRPIIAVVDPESEVASVVRENDIGWLAEPDNAEALADAICLASEHHNRFAEMGERARALAQGRYSFAHALEHYERLISEVARAG